MNRHLALYVLLLASACASDEDSGSEQERNGGDRDPCAEAEAEAEVIGWEAQSEVGSPADAFAAAERSCEAELSWNGATFDDRSIEPLTGHSPVTVELVLERDSARWIARHQRGGIAGPCGGYLEVDGNVTLETDDGTFRTERAVTLRRAQGGPALSAVTYDFNQQVADHEGSLSIELHDGETGTLSYRIDGSGSACAGEIRLDVGTSSEGMGSFASGQLAQWSDSACPLGQALFDLTEPGPDEVTLAAAIEDAWGDVALAGSWLDGQDAELALHVEVPDEVACREVGEEGAVIVPVRATYSTSDGRLQERTVDASVRATVGEGNAVRQLDFWLSDEQVCADESDSLEYELADCAELELVTVQLGFNLFDGSSAPEVTDEGLNVYLAPRGGGEPPAGDRFSL